MRRLLLCRCRPWLVLLPAVLLITSCSSTDNNAAKPAPPRDGIAEYRQVDADASQGLRAALDSLSKVGAQSDRCLPEVLASFSDELQRLQVGSIPIRARAQAMQARGDAYFANWHEKMAQVKDPAVRALVEQHRTELEKNFQNIKELGRQAREAYDPFVSDLRKLRNALESDPGSLGAHSTQALIRTASDHGGRMEKCLGGITQELDSMRAMVTPSKM